MKEYLVWYRKPYDDQDRVMATARNYTLAEQLAESLYFDLRSRRKEVMSVGVKRSMSGTLYKDDDFDYRWVVKSS